MVSENVGRFFKRKTNIFVKLIYLSNILMQYMKCLEHKLFNRDEVQDTNTN